MSDRNDIRPVKQKLTIVVVVGVVVVVVVVQAAATAVFLKRIEDHTHITHHVTNVDACCPCIQWDKQFTRCRKATGSAE